MNQTLNNKTKGELIAECERLQRQLNGNKILLEGFMEDHQQLLRLKELLKQGCVLENGQVMEIFSEYARRINSEQWCLRESGGKRLLTELIQTNNAKVLEMLEECE